MRLLLYYFANPITGLGHFYRSTALAKIALERGHTVLVAGDRKPDGLPFMPCIYESRGDFKDAVEAFKPDWVLVDLPHTPPEWIRETVKGRICTLNGIGYNQNDGADLRIIQGMSDVKLPGKQDKVPVLKGIEYVIIRPDTWQYRQEQRSPMTFVWGGGTDGMRLLSRFGLVYPQGLATLVMAEMTPAPQIVLPRHTALRLTGNDFLSWLGGSQQAVMAMGMSAWEAVALDVKSYVFSYTPLHLAFAEAMDSAGLIKAWPGVGLPTSDEMRDFINTPFEIAGNGLDTDGARRVVEAIEKCG